MRHGGDPDFGANTAYRVIGETNATSGELIHAIKTAFPMLPDNEVLLAIEEMRYANDVYGFLCECEEER